MKAAIHKVGLRTAALRKVSLKSVWAEADSGVDFMALSYGIRLHDNGKTYEVTRVGNLDYHRSLPIQSKMRRCLLLDDGTVNYYLSDNDSTLKAPEPWYDNLLLNSGVPVENNNYPMTFYHLAEAPKDGDDVTITIYGELGDNKQYFRCYNGFGYTECHLAGIWSNQESKFVLKCKWVSDIPASLYPDKPINKRLVVYSAPNVESSPTRIDKIKMEYGTESTEWCPAKGEAGIPAILDGTDGQVMVEIPQHYRRHYYDKGDYVSLISEYPLPGFFKVPKMYRSAYEASLDRTDPANPKLSSVVNTSPEFRGGNNNAEWDGTYRSLLGMPATNILLANFRKYARNRGVAGLEGCGWNCDVYQAQLATYWLYVIEYGNLNVQATLYHNDTSDGYKQGGFNKGVTTMSASNWKLYNGNNPLVNVGCTNSLGNKSDVVNVSIDNNEGLTYKFEVPSYRGIENVFGHIWDSIDGALILMQSDVVGARSILYICDNPAHFGDSLDSIDKYQERGAILRNRGFIKEILGMKYGDNIALSTSNAAGSSTYFCDYYNVVMPTTESLCSLVFGGCAESLYNAGLVCEGIRFIPYNYSTSVGTRLCFLPDESATPALLSLTPEKNYILRR